MNVIFNLDGPLLNTIPTNWKSFNTILAEHGVCISDQDIPKYVGRSLREQISMWNEEYGLDIEYEEFSERARSIQRDLQRNTDLAQPGIKRLLQRLQEQGVAFAVEAARPGTQVDYLLAQSGLQEYFELSVTLDETGSRDVKDLLVYAVDLLGGRHEDVWHIDDSPSGIHEAKQLGLRTIGYQLPNSKPLTEADYVVYTHEQLENILFATNKK